MNHDLSNYIGNRWGRTMHRLGLQGSRDESLSFTDLCRRYAEPHRFYHTLDHLRSCFEVLDAEMAKLPGQGSIELALWYHDVVYDTQKHDNEEKSAQLAEAHAVRIVLSEAFAQQVGNLIRATTHKNPPGTREAQVLIDVDLSVLSAPDDVFDKYERDVRAEYRWVKDPDFKAGRAKILESFLARDWLYSTPEFRNSWREGKARENLTRSLAALRA